MKRNYGTFAFAALVVILASGAALAGGETGEPTVSFQPEDIDIHPGTPPEDRIQPFETVNDLTAGDLFQIGLCMIMLNQDPCGCGETLNKELPFCSAEPVSKG